MRTARSAYRAGLRAAAGVAALTAAMFVAPLPARAEAVWVRLTPSTIQAGFQITIQASCGDPVNPAVVKSEAFGEVRMQPHGAGSKTPNEMTAAVTVPGNIKPMQYNVRLTCGSNPSLAANTTLWVIGQDTPAKGPATGGGGVADNGTLMISGGAAALGLGAVLMVAHYRRRAGA
jgi:hypothetical protein